MDITNVMNVIATTLGEKSLQFDMDFDSIQVNSFQYINLIVRLEEQFDIVFEDDMLILNAFPTVGDLVQLLRKVRCLNK